MNVAIRPQPVHSLLIHFICRRIESAISLDVRQARQRLQSILESQRLGKSEWGWRDTPSALVALQLNDPSWCFSSESNQRSIDRMEIGLLAEISKYANYRCTVQSSLVIAVVRLACLMTEPLWLID